MKKLCFALCICGVLLATTSAVLGWGVWGHNHINKGAVLALPPEMGLFFYNHSDFITEESTVPDLRKHLNNDKNEAARHFIDLEDYNYKSRADMPKTLADATNKYGKPTLEKYGTLPWSIQDVMAKLTQAFKEKHKTEIVYLAADLGHYVADANMPLHTTENHDGQLTGQQGIHAFWEAQLPELFGKNYNLYTGEAHYIKDINKATWDMIDSSYGLVGKLLHVEEKMKKDNPEDKQYEMGTDGKPLTNRYGSPVHTYEYAHIYHELLDGMVERQMRKALAMTASYWYTAWVNAGKPNLTDLDPDYVTEHNRTLYKEDMRAWKKGKVRGCRSDRDF